jgi:FKBP-type peptidyl-prolyl cis-trans isomerase
MCLAVALLAAGCNSNDGGGSPTDPSQVNIQFSTTDLVVGTGAEAVAPNRATLNFELWLYNASGTASKGSRVQGSDTAGPLTIVMGTGQIVPPPGTVITGFEQGVRGMRVGGKRRIYIPPSLAWGSAGAPPAIPPNASVVFEVELTNVVVP